MKSEGVRVMMDDTVWPVLSLDDVLIELSTIVSDTNGGKCPFCQAVQEKYGMYDHILRHVKTSVYHLYKK